MGYDIKYVLDLIAPCVRVSLMTRKSPDVDKFHRSEEIAILEKIFAITVFVEDAKHCLSEATDAKLLIQSDLLNQEKIKVRISGKLGIPFESRGEQKGKIAVGFIPEVVELLDLFTNERFQTMKLF